MWHRTKEKKEDWLDAKALLFAQEERIGTWLRLKIWLDEYIYSDIHEIFFAEFPILLHEWLVGLLAKKTNFQRRETDEWSDHLVQEVTSVSNSVSGAVDFWVDSILQGCITEFAVDTIT